MWDALISNCKVPAALRLIRIIFDQSRPCSQTHSIGNQYPKSCGHILHQLSIPFLVLVVETIIKNPRSLRLDREVARMLECPIGDGIYHPHKLIHRPWLRMADGTPRVARV